MQGPEIQVDAVEPMDEGVREEWCRVTLDTDLRFVSATGLSSGDVQWQVSVSMMEFVRQDPLQSELATAITKALTEVAGVEKAYAEDREVWAIEGSPEGPPLVRAAAQVVDAFYAKAKAAYDALDASV